MLRNVSLEKGPPVLPCGRLPGKSISEFDEGGSENCESSETDAAMDPPSFAHSSFTCESSRDEANAWGQRNIEKYNGGSAFAATTGNLSDDDTDDEARCNARKAKPAREQQSPLHVQPLNEMNSMQDLLGILLAPSNALAGPPSSNPHHQSGSASAAADGVRSSVVGEEPPAADPSALPNVDSSLLPDIPSLLQTLGSRSRPYGVGLVPAEVITAQLVFAAISPQPPLTGDDDAEAAGDPTIGKGGTAPSSEPSASCQGPQPEVVQRPTVTVTASQLLPATAPSCTLPLAPFAVDVPTQQPQQPRPDDTPSAVLDVRPQLQRPQPQPQQRLPQCEESQQDQQVQPAFPLAQVQHQAQPVEQHQQQRQHQQLQPAFAADLSTPPHMQPLVAQQAGGTQLQQQQTEQQQHQQEQQHEQQWLQPQPQARQPTASSGAGTASSMYDPLSPAPCSRLAAALQADCTATDAPLSCTGNNDELIAALAAAALGAVPCSVGGLYVDTSTNCTGAARRPPLAGGLRVHPPAAGSSGASASRQVRYDSYGARGSSSGMAEFPDEAALAAVMAPGPGPGTMTGPGSVCGSAPGTPPVSPHGATATGPLAPWCSPPLNQPPQQQQQTQLQQPEQQQEQQQQKQQPTAGAADAPPVPYLRMPTFSDPDPDPSPPLQQPERHHERERAPGSPGIDLNPAAAVAAYAPLTSGPAGLPSGGRGSGPGVSPFALACPNRIQLGGNGGGGASAVAVGDFRRLYDNLGALYGRDTGSGPVSSADCSSGAMAHLGDANLSVPRGRSTISGGELSVGAGGVRLSFSGAGLSGLTLGSAGGSGSISISGGGTGAGAGAGAVHKRSRTQPHSRARTPSATTAAADDDGGSSGGEGDGGPLQGSWRQEELPAPVPVTVTGLSREVGADGRRRRVTVQGVFHADRYLSNQDCILYENKFISRSAFEKAGGSTTAKWHCSIKVAGTNGTTLGNWLTARGLPVLKGGTRKSKRQRAVEPPPPTSLGPSPGYPRMSGSGSLSVTLTPPSSRRPSAGSDGGCLSPWGQGPSPPRQPPQPQLEVVGSGLSAGLRPGAGAGAWQQQQQQQQPQQQQQQQQQPSPASANLGPGVGVTRSSPPRHPLPPPLQLPYSQGHLSSQQQAGLPISPSERLHFPSYSPGGGGGGGGGGAPQSVPMSLPLPQPAQYASHPQNPTSPFHMAQLPHPPPPPHQLVGAHGMPRPSGDGCNVAAEAHPPHPHPPHHHHHHHHPHALAHTHPYARVIHGAPRSDLPQMASAPAALGPPLSHYPYPHSHLPPPYNLEDRAGRMMTHPGTYRSYPRINGGSTGGGGGYYVSGEEPGFQQAAAEMGARMASPLPPPAGR